MPRIPFHTLIWSREQRLYELYTPGQWKRRLRAGDETVWQIWLGEASSLNVYQEVRSCGGQ
jgi:hypothetical protein